MKRAKEKTDKHRKNGRGIPGGTREANADSPPLPPTCLESLGGVNLHWLPAYPPRYPPPVLPVNDAPLTVTDIYPHYLSHDMNIPLLKFIVAGKNYTCLSS
jgi:hypothetical protein